MNQQLFLKKAGIPLFLLLFSFGWFAGKATGQEPNGRITGRVIAPDNTPIAGATVTAIIETTRAGFPQSAANATTDSDGNFTLTELPPRLYRLRASAIGYTQTGFPVRARIGETSNITLTRGGVVTGRVTDRENLPIVEAVVQVLRVADAEGNRLKSPEPSRAPLTLTDDRGEYRKWGLPPGRYLVWIESPQVFPRLSDPLENEGATYYPGVSRAGAKEVLIAEGAETTGIDIRHLGQRGYTVSGQLTGTENELLITIELFDAETHVPVVAGAAITNRSKDFSVSGVPPGTYDLIAATNFGNNSRIFSDPVRLIIKNRDVTGITVSLSPGARLSGTVSLTPAEKTIIRTCGVEPVSSVEEVSFSLILKMTPTLPPSSRNEATAITGENGAFQARGLVAGDYALAVVPPSGWYVASATEPANPKPKPVGSLTLKKGASRDGIAVTLEFGSATLRGTVSNLPKAAEEVEKLRVHLIPLEETQVENPARYYETTITPDGGFELKNLAPGQYAVVVLKKDVAEGENPAFPLALDPVKRKLLRDAAKSAKTIELTPCRPVEGLKVERPDKSR